MTNKKSHSLHTVLDLLDRYREEEIIIEPKTVAYLAIIAQKFETSITEALSCIIRNEIEDHIGFYYHDDAIDDPLKGEDIDLFLKVVSCDFNNKFAF